MECNKDEALRAKNLAQNKMMNNDFQGARKFALKAKKLFPQLDNLSQMLAVCDVHCAAKTNINGASKDLYGILQLQTLADLPTIKKQYRKLALVLHPDKNQFPGAESAFKLIGEAHIILSDNAKRSLYDYNYRQPAVLNPQTSQFWTICIFCMKKDQYNRDLVNKSIRCSNCSKVFTAIDIGAWKPTHSAHAGMQNVNRGMNTSFQQEKAKADPQRAEPSFSRSANQPPQYTKTEENGDAETKGGKEECSTRSRKRSRVSNGDEVVADCSPKTRSKDKQKEAPTDANLKEEEDDDSEFEDDSKPPVYVDVPDLEFSNFDKDKEEDCFAADQIWAVYDTIDSMPRFYAQIRKVYSSGFRLRITWLEADPENDLERGWAEEGLPVACGRFKRGATEETNDRLMFSHQMAVEKGRKRFSFVVYPKRGEIWALFKDWDIIKWVCDSKSQMKYNFEIVEILSDFDDYDGVVVGYMVKVKGFVSLFQKAEVDECRIPPSDLFRFSHNIPSLKLTGKERANVPVGSFELDTASIPDDLNQFESTSDTATSARGDGLDESKLVIHDFSLDKQNLVFKLGQIWALGRSENTNLKCYAQIKKIESGPLRLHVDLLELCSDPVRPYACGIYKAASTDGRKILHQDSFLYPVKAEINGKTRFNIYPTKNEIWVLCKQNDADAVDDGGDCDIVEVIENNGDVIKVLFLTHVCGYKSVFKGGDRVVEVTIAESDRFLYRVPAVCLTDEQDGRLRGFWELDVAEFPGNSLFVHMYSQNIRVDL